MTCLVHSLPNNWNFMLKHKHRHDRKEIFQVLRRRLEDIGYRGVARISSKEEEQIMVVRFRRIKTDARDRMQIEDEDDVADILVPDGIVWIGLLCAVEVVFTNNIYQLRRVVDMTPPILVQPLEIFSPLRAYRVLFVRGPFWPVGSLELKGLRLLESQLHELRSRLDQPVNCVVVMGPLISAQHDLVLKLQLPNCLDQEYEQIVHYTIEAVRRNTDNADIVFMPSLEDALSPYPLPQPPLNLGRKPEPHVHFASNPATLEVVGPGQAYRLSLINEDLLRFIENNKLLGGKQSNVF